MSNKTNPTENVSQTSVNTKTSARPTENVRQAAKHSKPKEHHKLTNAGRMQELTLISIRQESL